MDPLPAQPRGKPRGPRGRYTLYVFPVVAVACVAFALLTAGPVHPYRVARVWGGPTDASRVAFRIEVFDVVPDQGGGSEELPVRSGSAAVHVARAGSEAARVVSLNVEGGAEVAVEVTPSADPLAITVSQAATELAGGAVALDAARWASVARRRGGFVSGAAGPFEVRVAAARGAFAVPFVEPLVVEVRRAGAPVAGGAVSAKVAGGAVTSALRASTDARGRARFELRPDEHSLSVTLHVEDASGSGDVSFGLSVVPGALRATLDGRTLVVESPVPREVAYFALVTEHERLLAGRLALVPDARGRSSARFDIPPGLAPTYAVVSSERDLRSPSAIGWPLAASDEPSRTFDAVEALLVDGRPRAALHEARRVRRVRWVTAAFCAAALVIELALLVWLTRASDRALDAHLEGAGVGAEDASRLAPKRSKALLLALLLVALGFVIVALVGILKLG